MGRWSVGVQMAKKYSVFGEGNRDFRASVGAECGDFRLALVRLVGHEGASVPGGSRCKVLATDKVWAAWEQLPCMVLSLGGLAVRRRMLLMAVHEGGGRSCVGRAAVV